MLHILCYGAALAVNVFWLVLGNQLPLTHQLLVPAAAVLLAGSGVALRLPNLPGSARKSYLRGALWALFLYYLAILSVLLFFGGLFHLKREWGGTVNLEPLRTIRNYIRFYRNTGSPVSILNLLGNVVIMVPMGALLPLLFHKMRRFWLCLPLCALIAGGVEFVQWLTATGAADVDDSLLNFIGAGIGYMAVRAGGWLLRRRSSGPQI